MSYSLEIEEVGASGAVRGMPAIRVVDTIDDAFGVIRQTVERARPLPQSMRFRVFGSHRKLVLSYVSADAEAAAVPELGFAP